MKLISTATVLSLLVTVLTSCISFAPVLTETLDPTKTILPTSTNTPEPIVTQIETPTPRYTETANPFTFVDTQDGKQIINSRYGFTITLPSDIDGLTLNPKEDILLSAQFPPKDLSDGGQILAWFSIWVEDQADSCHAELINSSDRPVKRDEVILGDIRFTKVYTPDLDKDELQALEYMTYGTDSCMHFFIGLFMYYFDRGDAQPGNMLPYVEDEMDSIISTFRWIRN